MEKIKVSVEFSDIEYSKSLEKALLLRYHNIVISKDTPEVTINETLSPPFLPVRSYYEVIMAKMNRETGPAKPQENVKYIAFTSAGGGNGLTTTALCYARLASRIFGRKVGFISFDPNFRNKFNNDDEYGVQYFFDWPVFADIDELVLDISSTVDNYQDLLDVCETRIVITGFSDSRYSLCDEYFKMLCDSAQTYVISPKTYRFENHFEENPNSADIHGQLGKEMLEFAKELEREQTAS